eukprot:364615-Chlamydomonas_euryale.AAC.16
MWFPSVAGSWGQTLIEVSRDALAKVAATLAVQLCVALKRELRPRMQVNGSDRAASEALADRLVDAVSNEIICWQESGLSLPTTS